MENKRLRILTQFTIAVVENYSSILLNIPKIAETIVTNNNTNRTRFKKLDISKLLHIITIEHKSRIYLHLHSVIITAFIPNVYTKPVLG